MTIIEKIEREQMRLDIPAFKPGDTSVSSKVKRNVSRCSRAT